MNVKSEKVSQNFLFFWVSSVQRKLMYVFGIVEKFRERKMFAVFYLDEFILFCGKILQKFFCNR